MMGQRPLPHSSFSGDSMNHGDNEVLAGLLSGMPKCLHCHLPARREATLILPASSSLPEYETSWLLCGNLNHKLNLNDEKPTSIKTLACSTYIEQAFSQFSEGWYNYFLLVQELKRLNFVIKVVCYNQTCLLSWADNQVKVNTLETLAMVQQMEPSLHSFRIFINRISAPVAAE